MVPAVCVIVQWNRGRDPDRRAACRARTYLHRESLQRLEAMLDQRFVRIHRSRLVNRSRIRELRRQGRRDLIVVLSTGVELPVARSQQAAVRGLY